MVLHCILAFMNPFLLVLLDHQTFLDISISRLITDLCHLELRCFFDYSMSRYHTDANYMNKSVFIIKEAYLLCWF